jgi:hypothetical protein
MLSEQGGGVAAEGQIACWELKVELNTCDTRRPMKVQHTCMATPNEWSLQTEAQARPAPQQLPASG